MKIFIEFALICLICCVYSAPKPPIWFENWSSDFTLVSISNSSSITVTQTSTGSFWYSASQNSMRQDLYNPAADFFCASVVAKPGVTCSLVFVPAGLYINVPELDFCCQCCTAADDCLALQPDWVSSQGVYQGSVQFDPYSSATCDQWLVVGGQNNYWYQDTENGTPCELNNGEFEVFLYDQTTFSTNPIPPAVFNIPSGCTQQCPGNQCF